MDCPHRPPCPGCPRFGSSEAPPRARRITAELARSAKLPEPPFHRTSGRGHRHRARLAIRGRSNSPKIGLFQSGSHRIVDTPTCVVHHPLINQTAQILRRAIRETGVEPYADRPHRGALRYAQFVVERASGRVQVVLVGNGSDPKVLGDLPGVFSDHMGSRLQGLFFNAQPERSNSIFGAEMHHLGGEPATREEFAEATAYFPPAAFGQNHLTLFEEAVHRIARIIPDGSIISEMYCGVGAISLGLLDRMREVRFNEIHPAALHGLELGIRDRPESERARARVFPGRAGDRLDALPGADVVIVDPPRRGLDPDLCGALATHPPRRLIYLACGLDRLVEDLDRLTANQRMRLVGIETFDFFPFTDHVETLVWLDRTSERSSRAPNEFDQRR